jgi:hypothetical protein
MPTKVKMYGDYVFYKVNQIEITFYGDTIGIDLTDGTITYGSGKKPFSLSGNELMQDSAKTQGKLTTEYIADNILRQYKLGKEKAVLQCSIDNYYDNDSGEKLISVDASKNLLQFPYDFTTKNLNGVTCRVKDDGTLSFNGTHTGSYTTFHLIDNPIFEEGTYYASGGDTADGIYLQVVGYRADGSAFFGINNSFTINKGDYVSYIGIAISQQKTFDKYEIKPMVNRGKYPLEYSKYENLPMIFSLHDKVIPMVYSAGGKDTPMSLHPDGTPKEFVVLGNDVYYDGSVMQEIILQEIAK